MGPIKGKVKLQAVPDPESEPPPGRFDDDEPVSDDDLLEGGASRREIVIGPDFSRVVDESIEAIAESAIFQRQGALVDVVRTATAGKDGVTRPEGSARIRLLPSARLREMLSLAIDYKRKRQTDDGWKLVSVTPPADVVAAVAARGEWSFIRRLAGIAEWPCLRPDGTVLETPGYDPLTTLLYEPTIEVAVPLTPTPEEARAAVADLFELVRDFPFGTPVHRSAWLAALLTLLARPAIDGPTPLTLIDASERGSGKTLLADVIGMIVCGRPLSRRTAPEDPAEWKKAMLAIAIAADPIILIDNVVRQLRSDALDAVLTGTTFRERILGRNEELTLDVRTVFVATANNATLSADLVRRSLHVRLEAQSERPEQRTGFQHPNLLEHIKEHRARYLTAALTVLRGYFAAGCKPQRLRPMGSFEAWSRVVRGSLVWCGLPDPVETQDALREGADPEQEALADLFAAWHAVYGERATTVRQALGDLVDPDLAPQEQALRDAVSVFCDAEPGKLPSLRKLGSRLRGARGRIIRGILFERAAEHSNAGAAWRTRKVSQ